MPETVGLGIFDIVNDAILTAFGEPEKFTLTRSTGDPVEAEGVFDARHFEVDVGGEVGVSEYQTMVACRRDAIDPVSVGDQVEVRGATYTVRDIRPDSEGWVILALWREDGT